MNSKTFKQDVLPLAERIYPMVARMLQGHENAEDAVQEIIIRLWQQRVSIANHPNLNALVFRAARNYCIDQLRKKNLVLQSYDATLHDRQVEHDGHEADLNELHTVIRNILQELPEKQAEVLMLRDLDQLEFVEIAAAMDLKVENVRMLLSRARKKMGEKLTMIYNYELR